MDIDVITGALGHRTLYMELNNLSATGGFPLPPPFPTFPPVLPSDN